MPRGFVDDPEGDVADEEVNDGGFGDDILAADADGIDVLLLNVGQHHNTSPYLYLSVCLYRKDRFFRVGIRHSHCRFRRLL